MEQVHDKILSAYFGEMGEQFMRDTQARVHWVCASVEGTNVLDVGCSQGIVPVLLGREGTSVVGVDSDAMAIATANEFLSKQGGGVKECVTFVNADFATWEPVAAPYDTIVMSEVLEHLVRPALFVKRAAELLREDGRLVVTLPFGINDFIDHKKTYYAFEAIQLSAEHFDLENVEFFGKWIGFRFRKRKLGAQPDTAGWPWELMLGVEGAFLGIERQLVQQVSSLREQSKAASERVNAANAELQRVKVELASTNAANTKHAAGLTGQIEALDARLNCVQDELLAATAKYEAELSAKAASQAAIDAANTERLAAIAQVESIGEAAETLASFVRKLEAELDGHLQASSELADVQESLKLANQRSLEHADVAAELAEKVAAFHDGSAERERYAEQVVAELHEARDLVDKLGAELEEARHAAGSAQVALAVKERDLTNQLGQRNLEIRQVKVRLRESLKAADLSLREVSSALSTLRSSAKVRAGEAISDAIRSPRALIRLPFSLLSILRDWMKFRSGVTYQVQTLDLPEFDYSLLAESCPDEPEELPGDAPAPTTCAMAWVTDYFKPPSVIQIDSTLPGDSTLHLLSKGISFKVPILDSIEVMLSFEVLASEGSVPASIAYFGNGEASGTEGEQGWRENVLIPAEQGKKSVLVLRPPVGATRVEISITNDVDAAIRNTCGLQYLRPGISVVVPSFKGAATIRACLESLVSQKLAHEMYEVIVVFNGEQDGSADIVRELAHENPTLQIRIISLRGASVGNARNVGISSARREFIAFVDDDDAVSADYLSSMYRNSEAGAITVAQIRDVVEGVPKESVVNDQVRAAALLVDVKPSHVPGILTMNACKIVPTAFAKQIRFDKSLRSGEDVHYFTHLLCRFNPRLRIAPLADGAIYHRTVRQNSVSRQAESFDFNVVQRLDVVERLVALMPKNLLPEQERFATNALRSQLQFAVRYITNHPETYGDFNQEVRRRGLSGLDCIHWANGRLADTVVFSYCFPPNIDTAGIVMAKRLRVDGRAVDIISNNMDSVRRVDRRLLGLIDDLVGSLEVLATPVSFGSWSAIARYAEEAVARAELLGQRKSSAYRQLYSRAMWPGSHFAAAAYKAKYPDSKWRAEFSDPIWVDMRGQKRDGEIDLAWVNSLAIADVVRQLGIAMPTETSLFFWCEFLPYVLADELVFTNKNQLQYMLSYAPDAALRGLVESKARIVPQPTLPAAYYSMAEPPVVTEREKFNVAYFGSFYESRGLGDVLAAIARLDPSERRGLKLHVFSDQCDALRNDPSYEAIQDVVELAGLVGYLEFLALTNEFDCLLVCDAITAGVKVVNPYLPSKISDYMGSNADVWAIVEPGSSLDDLSREPAVTHRTELGDIAGHIDVLRNEIAARTVA